jgi:hypothetical protein
MFPQVYWAVGYNASTAYTKLVVNNLDNDAGDLNLATSDSAVVVGTTPSIFLSEIVLVRKGSLSFLPPSSNVTSVFLVAVGATTGDGQGRLRVDARVSLTLVPSLSTVLTPVGTSTYTQVGTGGIALHGLCHSAWCHSLHLCCLAVCQLDRARIPPPPLVCTPVCGVPRS